MYNLYIKYNIILLKTSYVAEISINLNKSLQNLLNFWYI